MRINYKVKNRQDLIFFKKSLPSVFIFWNEKSIDMFFQASEDKILTFSSGSGCVHYNSYIGGEILTCKLRFVKKIKEVII